MAKADNGIVEHVAGATDFQVAMATYHAARKRWPKAAMTLREGTRVIEDSRRTRIGILFSFPWSEKSNWTAATALARPATRPRPSRESRPWRATGRRASGVSCGQRASQGCLLCWCGGWAACPKNRDAGRASRNPNAHATRQLAQSPTLPNRPYASWRATRAFFIQRMSNNSLTL